MNPKEKARELYNMYWKIIDTLTVKKCALITVNEILQIDCCDMSEDNFNNHIEY